MVMKATVLFNNLHELDVMSLVAMTTVHSNAVAFPAAATRSHRNTNH
jgi:hypothetical protein